MFGKLLLKYTYINSRQMFYFVILTLELYLRLKYKICIKEIKLFKRL